VRIRHVALAPQKQLASGSPLYNQYKGLTTTGFSANFGIGKRSLWATPRLRH